MFLKFVRPGWFAPIAKLIERITIPGILLHYALRKKCIAGLVRSALVDGTTQVVIIGAGFAFPKFNAERLHFLPVDLSAAALDREALIKNAFDPVQRTFWVAEGLLMYLPANIATSLMTTLKTLSAPGSQFAFTFMEKQGDGRIRFDSQSKLVDWWLRGRGEPFLWACTRGELADLVRPWHIDRFFDHDDFRQTEPGLADQPIAKGEVICLTEV